MEDNSTQQIFQVSSPARLYVENIRGSVFVRAGETQEIIVQAAIDLQSGQAERTHVELSQDPDGTVRAVTRMDSGRGLSGSGINPCKVSYIITAPHACDVEVSAVTSSVVTEGLQGRVNIRQVSGSVALTDLAGTFEIDSVSGSVTGLRLSGEFPRLKTVSGAIQLGDSQVTRLSARTVSGDIAIESPLVDGPYELETVSGDARLVVPQETHCEVSSRSFSGETYVGLSSTYLKHSGRSQRIVVQDGGPQVSFRSMSGGLSILTAEQIEHPAPHQPEVAAAPPDEPDRMRILERIGRGELSVDEGIRLLGGEDSQ
jgi:hypothetical protein